MKVLLGVSGGIAAYKAAGIVRALVKRGDEVRVVMTAGAQEFITPMTLQILSEAPVGTDLFDPTWESEIGHIELARWPDVVLIAPATANTIARAVAGLADDLLTTVLLATGSPVVLAPAMNTHMYLHPATQRNMRRAEEELGYMVVTPDSGELACKEVGAGRLPDPPALLAAIDRAVGGGALRGKKVVVTAGPTREMIDPARFISNPSSGKMGYALAAQAWAMGAEVVLVSGPTALEAPPGVRRVDIVSARDLHAAVWAEAPDADLVIKVAAVADWRPAAPSDRKRPKSEMSTSLELERNPDVLAELCARFGPEGEEKGPVVVGFAAESHDVTARGTAKLARKGAHALVANQIGGPTSAFGADASSATVLFHAPMGRAPVDLGPAPKTEVARGVLEALLDAGLVRRGTLV